MRQRAIRQRQLFDESKPFPRVELQPDVQRETVRLLVQWLQALAKAINEEAGDEQDRR